MSDTASIKGSTLIQLIEDLNKLREDGRLTDDELERRLPEEDRQLFRLSISPSGWYPVAAHARILELCRDVLGDGSNEFLVLRGRAHGQRLMDAGLYQQMEYASRAQVLTAEPDARFRAFGRDLKLMVTLSQSILNFSSWKSEPDPEHPLRYRIEVTDAADFPDALVYSTEGLIDSIATQIGHAGMWSWRRVAPDHIRFFMTRDV